MLWWVLLCDYCSSFCHFPKTSELCRAINAHIIVVAYYSDHCLLFRVCSFAELSSAFLITALEGAVVVYTNISIIFFFSELHHTSMGHARLVCTQLYILFSTRLSEDRDTGSFSFQRVTLKGPTLAFLYNYTVEEKLMDFGYTFAPNLIHQGASVITEISSAYADKNSTSSKQQ
jgi:hypothetical protein